MSAMLAIAAGVAGGLYGGLWPAAGFAAVTWCACTLVEEMTRKVDHKQNHH